MKSKKTETKQEEQQVKIPGVNLKTARFTIEGTSPLLVNRFSEKAKQEIEDKQLGVAKQKKAFRKPEEEYQGSLYKVPGTKDVYGVPSNGLKLMAVSACKYVDGIAQTFCRGAFHVQPGVGGLTPIRGKPVMDEGMVRIGPFGKKVAMPRYRGRFDRWEIDIEITYNANVISASQILNLYETSGFAVGLCEWRPEKNGSHGMFKVKR